MSDRTAAAIACAVRAEIVNFVNFTGLVTAEPVGRIDWASVTFSGARHLLRVTLEGPGAVGAAADFLERMSDLDFAIEGGIVADLALVAEERRDGGGFARLYLTALTIEGT